MSNCGCKTAECVINNYWQCKTPGCKNGPSSITTTTLSNSNSGFIELAAYECAVCGNVSIQYRDEVANGKRCKVQIMQPGGYLSKLFCDGALWRVRS
jgi:hypothetical protein